MCRAARFAHTSGPHTSKSGHQASVRAGSMASRDHGKLVMSVRDIGVRTYRCFCSESISIPVKTRDRHTDMSRQKHPHHFSRTNGSTSCVACLQRMCSSRNRICRQLAKHSGPFFERERRDTHTSKAKGSAILITRPCGDPPAHCNPLCQVQCRDGRIFAIMTRRQH